MELILALGGILGTLGGIALGARLQRDAADHERRSMRIERAMEEKTRPISDYLHHASVILGLEPDVAGARGVSKVPDPVREVYQGSLTAMIGLVGPARVRAAMLDDKELTTRVENAKSLFGDLVRKTEGETLTTEERTKLRKERTKLWHDCMRAIADAQDRLEQLKEQAIRDKAKDGSI